MDQPPVSSSRVPGEVEAWARPALSWTPEPLIVGSVMLHAAALALAMARPSRWRLSLSMVVANHGVLSVAGAFPRSRWLGPNLCRLPADWPGPDVALTFDDGPDPDVTEKVAEMLEAAGVRGTFFCIGQHLDRHPKLARRLHEAGHRLENHTYFHRSTFAFSFPNSLRREIERTQRAIYEVTGRPAHYFRAPAGMRNPFMSAVLSAQGLYLASWTRRAFDTADGNPYRVEKRLMRDLKRGDILLLHDGNAATTKAGRPVVLDVLPRILERLEQTGLSAGPLPDVTCGRNW